MLAPSNDGARREAAHTALDLRVGGVELKLEVADEDLASAGGVGTGNLQTAQS